METDSTQKSMKWFEIWRQAFLHPTNETYSRIISDPKTGIKWGLIWEAITILVIWIIGPQRDILGAIVMDNFGRETFLYFSVIGAPVAVILGVLGFVFFTAIAHGLAKLFKGAGTFPQLIFCWAVTQLPFILLAGLVLHIPLGFSPSRVFVFSRIGLIIQIAKILVAFCFILYLFFAQIVAFSAVERFGIGKSFGIVILSSIAIGIIGSCLSYGLQAVVMNFLRLQY
ncbi:MAG: YIP1 family protein [Anaerolineales bacterium]